MDADGVDEDLLAEVADLAPVPGLIVACGFDGALADPTDDPVAARADQQSSEALNVLLALPDTTVAVVSRRPPDEVAELMFLSGAKGGLRVVTPDDLGALQVEVPDARMIVVDVDPTSLAAAREDDLAVAVEPASEESDGAYRVADVDGVIAVLECLVEARR